MVFHEKQNEKKTIQEIGNNNMIIDLTLVSIHKRINIIQIGMVLKWFHEEKKYPIIQNKLQLFMNTEE